MTSNSLTASFALLVCRWPMRCQRTAPRTSGFFSRASCTRFSPTSAMPTSIASSTADAGKVFETATSVTSLRARPTRLHAPAMRASTSATFSRIDTATLDPSIIGSALGTVERGVGQTIGVLIARAQRVADLEFREMTRHRFRALVQRHQVGMLDAVLAEHLLHEQQ